jgi:hypothetical protein
MAAARAAGGSLDWYFFFSFWEVTEESGCSGPTPPAGGEVGRKVPGPGAAPRAEAAAWNGGRVATALRLFIEALCRPLSSLSTKKKEFELEISLVLLINFLLMMMMLNRPR